jgi:hypothetical protein
MALTHSHRLEDAGSHLTNDGEEFGEEEHVAAAKKGGRSSEHTHKKVHEVYHDDSDSTSLHAGEEEVEAEPEKVVSVTAPAPKPSVSE